MNTAKIHNQLYEFYSWNDLGEIVLELSEKILKTNNKYDRIIALAKGGLTFSRSLVDHLQIPDISTIKIEFYTNIGMTTQTPVITQSLPVNIKGERILIYDDLIDSGETLELARQYLNQHGAKSIDTAVLFKKSWTKNKPSFFVKESGAWIIFPNEVRETIRLLSQNWHKKGDNQDTIKNNLLKLGFSQKELALFLTKE